MIVCSDCGPYSCHKTQFYCHVLIISTQRFFFKGTQCLHTFEELFGVVNRELPVTGKK